MHVCKFDHLFSTYDSLFFLLLSFSILYVKKRMACSPYIRYIIYSPCSFFTVRYHQRTGCCALSLSLVNLEQQPTLCKRKRNTKLFIALFFTRAERKRKRNTWYLCPKTSRWRGVCMGVGRRRNE